MYDIIATLEPAQDFVEQEFLEFLDRFENNPHAVKCRICKTTDTDTRKSLELKGWLLVSRGEFCPSH